MTFRLQILFSDAKSWSGRGLFEEIDHPSSVCSTPFRLPLPLLLLVKELLERWIISTISSSLEGSMELDELSPFGPMPLMPLPVAEEDEEVVEVAVVVEEKTSLSTSNTRSEKGVNRLQNLRLSGEVGDSDEEGRGGETR